MKRRLFPIFLMVAFLISNLFLKSAAAAQTKVNITGLNQEYVQGSSPTLYLTTTGVKGNVIYNVLLVDLVSGKKIDLTKGYSKPIKSNIKYSVKLPKLDNGYYRVFAYVKGEKSKTKYDGYAYKQFMVFVNGLNLSKAGSYGSNNERYLQTVKGSVNITGDNIVYKNSIVNKDIFIIGDNATLENIKIKGKLVLDPGSNGKVFLNNVDAKDIEVLSGASDSIYMNSVKTDELKIKTKDKVRIVMNNTTSINNIYVEGESILENDNANLNNIDINLNENKAVEFRGNFETKINISSSAYIKVSENSSLKEVNIMPQGDKANVVIYGNIKNLLISKDSTVEIKGSSKIEDSIIVEANANIKSEKDVKINKVQITGESKNIKLEAKIETLEIKANSKVELSKAVINTLVATSKGELLTDKETKVENIEGSKKDEIKISGEGQIGKKDDNQTNGNNTGTNTGGSTIEPIIVPVSSIDFDEVLVVLNKNEEVNLNYAVLPLSATDKRLIWESDNTNILIANNGKISARALGEAYITAKTIDQKVKKTIKVKVVDSGISLIVKRESEKISFLIKSVYDNDVITMKVLQNGNIKYLDQIQAGNNYTKISTVLDKGQYTIYIKGTNSEILSIPFEY